MNLKLVFAICLCFLLAAAVAAAEEDNAGKQKLLNDFRAKAVKLQAEYGVKPDLAPAEEICLDLNTTITECRRSIRAVEKGYEAQVKQGQVLPQQQESASIDQNIIINQGDYVRTKPLRPPGQNRPVMPRPLPRR